VLVILAVDFFSNSFLEMEQPISEDQGHTVQNTNNNANNNNNASAAENPTNSNSEPKRTFVVNYAETKVSLTATGVFKQVTGPEMFKKIALIGKGDVGKVYLVQNLVNNKYYAMKVGDAFIVWRSRHNGSPRAAVKGSFDHAYPQTEHHSLNNQLYVYFVCVVLALLTLAFLRFFRSKK
jgi:protein-serine/threonine kinase